jgi:hypothetical protein
MQNNKPTNRTPLILLLLVFIIPFILSGFLYYYHRHFQFKTTNHGTLINPPISMQTTEKKWQIIYISAGVCDKHCTVIQHGLNQVRLALGKNSHRVDVILAEPAVQSAFITAFNRIGQSHFIIKNKIYLIDPTGHLFMYYPSDTDLMHILQDLKRVLEVSQIG